MATNFYAISFSRIKSEIETYLKDEYNKSGTLFSNASPYGQILSVVQNLHQLSMLYLKNTINQFDLGQPNSNNPRVIRNAAILAGHIPSRAISATGTIRFTPKTSINIEEEIANAQLTFFNKTSIKNSTNGLFYSFNLGVEQVTKKIKAGQSFTLNIIQGEWKNQVFTGTGKPMQTFNISLNNQKDVENFYVEVLVSGQYWTIKTHVYDLLPDEQACVVRTGFNGGIDIIFGNGGFGMIPSLSQTITVRHIESDGENGNIYRRTPNDWKFIDEILDANGNNVEMSKVFDIDIHTDINFGAPSENIDFTKSVLPIASNNFVLALPQQFVYYLKRLGVFTHVNAKLDQGTIFIYLTPNIKLFKRQEEDYFSIPIKVRTTRNGQDIYSSAFDLDTYEKNKIIQYIKSGGNIMLTSRFKIESPTLSFYVMNVFVIRYSDATQDSVNSQIYSAISNYFLDLKRVDRIPKLDIIKELSKIKDIHSVDISFVCRKNEQYHRDGMLTQEYSSIKLDSSQYTNVSSGESSLYDPSKVLGLDPVLGDIIFEAHELPVIRGNWRDRNGVFYSDESPASSEGSSMKSVNVFVKGVVDAKNKNPL